ncbi:CbbBc protein, partial [Rhizobium ruizarguesonis]
AKATLGVKYGIDWEGMIGDYNCIREKVEVVFPDFPDFNTRVRKPGGFQIKVAASDRQWRTQSGKAQFLIAPGLEEDPR